MLAIYIKTINDKNGNPRRGWIIADHNGDFISFVDEGYQGKAALVSSGYGNVTSTASALEVMPSVYNTAYREAYGAIEKAMKRENKLYRKLR